MSPAVWPRAWPPGERLLVLDPSSGRCEKSRVADLPNLLGPGDLLVVNDAATLPASLRGHTADGQPIEVRLLASRDGPWRAVLFGAGDWRTRTEDRPPPPSVRAGDVLSFGDLRAHVDAIERASERLLVLRFEADPDAFYDSLYRNGRPVQYAHVRAPLPLWHVQTAFAARPWSSEMPSAGRPLRWETIFAIRARGARFASVTHAAGLSATGDPRLDAALPLRESYDVPVETARAVVETRAGGGRVIAVGTTVVRALEASARRGAGTVVAGGGDTDLVVDARHRLQAADGILTGMHEAGTSHDSLLQAFAPRALLARAFRLAEDAGFLGHEFGDSMLVAPARASRPQRELVEHVVRA